MVEISTFAVVALMRQFGLSASSLAKAAHIDRRTIRRIVDEAAAGRPVHYVQSGIFEALVDALAVPSQVLAGTAPLPTGGYTINLDAAGLLNALAERQRALSQVVNNLFPLHGTVRQERFQRMIEAMEYFRVKMEQATDADEKEKWHLLFEQQLYDGTAYFREFANSFGDLFDFQRLHLTDDDRRQRDLQHARIIHALRRGDRSEFWARSEEHLATLRRLLSQPWRLS